MIISATFFRLKILHSGIWDKIERLKCFAENGFFEKMIKKSLCKWLEILWKPKFRVI